MSGFAFDTAQNLINDAAVELGLAASSDVWASQDPNFIQLRGLLKSLGRWLWRKRRWSWLQQVYTFTTVQGQGRYDLPADFGSMIEQTGWNRTNRVPLAGPLSPQQWEFLAGWSQGVVYTVLFRPFNRQLWLYPPVSTPGSYAIAFEYASRYWAVPSATQSHSGPWAPGLSVTSGAYYTNGGNIYQATSTGTTGASGPTGTGTGISDGAVTWNYVSAWGTEGPAANDDVVLYEPLLIVKGLVLAFKRAKGFDTTAAQDDFDEALGTTSDSDSDGPVLSVAPKGEDAHLISNANLPATNWGT